MDLDSGSATLKLPSFSGSRLKDLKRWGAQITAVALSSSRFRLVANHVGNLFNPMVYPTQALNAAFTEPAPAYPTGTGADGGLTSTEQYHHDLAVADWTTRKKASKDVHDASTAQNMYLFNLLVAAISDTVRAKIATEVANSAEGSVIRTAQTTLGSKLDGPQFLALL